MISCALNLKKHCDTVDSVSLGVGHYPILSNSQRDISSQLYAALFNTPQKPSVLVITGEPGCGKSTILTYVTSRLALSDTQNHPELLTVPIRGAGDRPLTPHQILRTILEPYVPWSKTNGYDRHGLLRLLAGVILETYPRPTLFILDVLSTISEKELAVVAQTLEDLREVQHAVATDHHPPCILIACTPAIKSAILPISGSAESVVTTFTLENPTVQDVKIAVGRALTHNPLSRADDTEVSAARITAYTHHIHTLGLQPPNQSTFETARQITRRISPTTPTKDAIETAAAALVHDSIAPPWIAILHYLLPRYQNHVAYISTYDTEQNWNLDNVWFEIPQALLGTATAARPPGLLVRHPTNPTKVAVNAPESLVRWLITILTQPKPHPQPSPLPAAARKHANTTNPYTACTPNAVAYLAALHTTHRKRPEAFDLTHKEVYDEYLHICKRIDIVPKPLRKIYRVDNRLSSQGFIATDRMPHTRGRPSKSATMLAPHQLAQLRATMHILSHTRHTPSDAEILALKNAITKLCKSASAQHRTLEAILALMQRTKKRVLNTADIYATYSATVTTPISRSAFYATLSRLLKISHAYITPVATATITVDTPPSNTPDPPPP